ncbi:hypothetical protein GC177_05340 [bacterium]|nr:hypothetical protein [bacterium]
MPIIDNYTNLLTEVESEFSRSDLSGRIPRAVQAAEARMNRELRLLDMESLASLTTTPNQATIDLPQGSRHVRQAWLDGSPARLGLVSLTQLVETQIAGCHGRPIMMAVERDKLRLAPVPDGEYDIQLIHTLAVTPLTEAAPTNWLLEKHPDAYLYGTCSAVAAQLQNPDAMAYYDSMFSRVLDAMRQEDELRRVPSSSLVIRSEGRC